MAFSIFILVLPTVLLSLGAFPGSSFDSFLSPGSLAGIQPDCWTFALADKLFLLVLLLQSHCCRFLASLVQLSGLASTWPAELCYLVVSWSDGSGSCAPPCWLCETQLLHPPWWPSPLSGQLDRSWLLSPSFDVWYPKARKRRVAGTSQNHLWMLQRFQWECFGLMMFLLIHLLQRFHVSSHSSSSLLTDVEICSDLPVLA